MRNIETRNTIPEQINRIDFMCGVYLICPTASNIANNEKTTGVVEKRPTGTGPLRAP